MKKIILLTAVAATMTLTACGPDKVSTNTTTATDSSGNTTVTNTVSKTDD